MSHRMHETLVKNAVNDSDKQSAPVISQAKKNDSRLMSLTNVQKNGTINRYQLWYQFSGSKITVYRNKRG